MDPSSRVDPSELKQLDDPTSVYDVILDVTFLSQAGPPFEGWEIGISEEKKKKIVDLFQSKFENKEKLQENDERDVAKLCLDLPSNGVFVAVVGFFDRGKTWLLSQLSPKSELEKVSGMTITTKGLSCKLVDKRFVFLDTAGSNVPLQTELLKLIEDEFLKRGDQKYLHLLEKTRIGKPEDPAEVERWRKEKELAEEEKAEYIRSRAIVSKKGAEIFLSNLCFELADLFIYVVNEMTWVDQQSLHALKSKLDESRLIDPSRQRRLIVVHNFKTTTTVKQFEALRKKYIIDCFPGHENEVEVTMPGSGQKIPVKFWENSKRDMIHLCLAKEGSEAGDQYNQKTIECLRCLIGFTQGRQIKEDENFFTVLSKAIKQELGQFYRNIREVHLLYDPSNLSSTPLRLFASSLKPQEPLRLARDELEFDGLTISLKRPYEPHVDTIKIDDDTIVFVADIPGIIAKKDPKDLPQDYQGKVTFTIEQQKGRWGLRIRGERKLYMMYWNQDGTLADRCSNYDRFEKDAIVRRPNGEFDTFVPLPEEFVPDITKVRREYRDGFVQVKITNLRRSSEELSI